MAKGHQGSDMMKIYTKTGDKGETSLYDGNRVGKDDIRVESYGTIDELNSVLGIAKNYLEDDEAIKRLEIIQNKLFTVGAMLATRDKDKLRVTLTEEDVKELEEYVDDYMARIGELRGFILPGNNLKSAYLHLGRTVVRRAERAIIRLSGDEFVEDVVLRYVNRLSDFLFAMASFFEGERRAIDFKE